MQELNVSGLWVSKQTAKGTPNTAGTRRLIHVGGRLDANPTYGSEIFSDLGMFPDATDWLDTLAGGGELTAEATPEELAYLLWLFHGGEATSAIVGPPAKTRHTFQPIYTGKFWATFLQRMGRSIIDRDQFNDSLVAQLVLSGSTGDKALKAAATVLCLDPEQKKAAEPATAIPVKAPFLYTDGTSRFTIDGVVFRGHSAFTLTLGLDPQAAYGDAPTIHDVADGTPSVGISVTFYLDADGVAEYNKIRFGTAAPAADAKPIQHMPALGSYSFDLQAKDSAGAINGDKVTLNIPGVRWTPPTKPAPAPGGGVAELTLAGAMRKIAGQQDYTVAVDCDAAAFAT